ncbi:MAG TPA: hemolysin family protein [Pyrinomonadaceae bacterium]
MDDPAGSFLALFAADAPWGSSLIGIAIKFAAVLFFLLINAFFVGAEFALIAVRRPRLEARAAAGNHRAASALRLLDDPTLFINASQLGITIASLVLGALGEPAFAALIEPLALRVTPQPQAAYLAHLMAMVIALSLMTFLHMVLGELLPKMIALERAESLALFSSRTLEIFARLFRAPLWIFNRTGAGLARLFGLKSSLHHTAVYSEEELRQLVDISRESGHLRAEERRLIHRVFEFSDTLVREAMVPRTEMAAISIDCSLEDIRDAFQKHGYSRLPVYDGSLDNVAGFIHSKDLMPFLLTPEAFRLEYVLQPPMYIVDTARLEAVLRQMQKAKSHFGFVVDEHGGIEGIITLEDLLEEIVGEISDEHDEEVNEQMTKVDDRTYLLDGALAVRDLNKRLKAALPESENYITIGGFLMTEAGHVPLAGEVIEHDGLKFHVEKVERRRVLRVKLELLEKRDEMKSEDGSESESGSA